jgi:hypothetical protein
LISIPPVAPPLQGGEFVTHSKNTNRNLSTVCPQVDRALGTKLSEFIHRFGHLSTEAVDKCPNLWTSGWAASRSRGRGLWINLWITGVKSVDKPVGNSVDNSNLWITRELSTICPQGSASYPQFCPQPRGRAFGLSMADFAAYPHIHRPYYYYYSNKLMV